LSIDARRLAGWAWDVAAVAAALYVRALAQPRGAPTDPPPDAPDWWWRLGNAHDLVLEGPDAGHWAANAQAWLDGAPLDIHRLPVWTALTAGVARLTGDVVFAGHMVNHTLSALLAVVVYFLGRSTSGRAAATGAALLTALSPELVNNRFDYGVDPALQMAVLLVAATSWAAAVGRLPWYLAAGAAAGVAAGTHYLALVFAALALGILVFADRPWRRRLGGLGLAAASAGLVWWLLMRPYPELSLAQVSGVFAEGVAGSGGADTGPRIGLGGAIGRVLERADGALELAVQRGLRGLAVEGVWWFGLVGVAWLGLLGPWLKGEGWRARWRSALWLAAFLAPLTLLEAARAPDRYALYARPLLFLVVARGLAALPAGLDRLLRGRWPAWPGGLLGAAVVLAAVAGVRDPLIARWQLFPPTERGLAVRAAGLASLEAAGPGGGSLTTNQEFAYYARRPSCLGQPCPAGDAELAACLRAYAARCPGEGPIPYVAEVRDQRGFGDQPSAAMDRLVDARFEHLDDFVSRQVTLKLYLLERAEMEAVAAALVAGGVDSPPPR